MASVLLGWRTNLLFALLMICFAALLVFLLLLTGVNISQSLLTITLGVIAVAAFLSLSALALWSRVKGYDST